VARVGQDAGELRRVIGIVGYERQRFDLESSLRQAAFLFAGGVTTAAGVHV
jgi:hypothetical protein